MEMIIPEHLTGKENLVLFLAFLRDLRLDREDKKLFLIQWCDRFAVPLSAELVARAGAI